VSTKTIDSDIHELSLGGGEFIAVKLQYQCEFVDYQVSTRAREPDPDWLFEDHKGHLHIWTGLDEDPPRPRVPSCKIKQVPCDGACGDPSHTDNEYRCLDCKRKTVVEPGYRTARNAGNWQSFPSMESVTLELNRVPWPSTVTLTMGAKSIPAVLRDSETGESLEGWVEMLDSEVHMDFGELPTGTFTYLWRPADRDGPVVP
jgi:hypothetical protein